jgi:hypothetical protein
LPIQAFDDSPFHHLRQRRLQRHSRLTCDTYQVIESFRLVKMPQQPILRRVVAPDCSGFRRELATVPPNPDSPTEAHDQAFRMHGAEMSGGDACPPLDMPGDVLGSPRFGEKAQDGVADGLSPLCRPW